MQTGPVEDLKTEIEPEGQQTGETSDYELQRLRNIARNQRQLEALGLDGPPANIMSRRPVDEAAWDAAWEGQLARLAAYKAAHGDYNVPNRWPEAPRLGNWVKTQRAGKKKMDRGDPRLGMTAARVARLEALGFAWAPGPKAGNAARFPNEAWETQLARLAAYKAEHGDCNVPKGWAEDPRLAGWVSTQRKRKKALDRGDPTARMTASRAARLEALGFAWALSSEQISKRMRAASTDEAAWEAQLARLAAYKAAHGDCSVPQGWAEAPRLASWVSNQRHLKRRLDRGEPSQGMAMERAARLTALGLVWDPSLEGPRTCGWAAGSPTSGKASGSSTAASPALG
jgi:hypothetical protein